MKNLINTFFKGQFTFRFISQKNRKKKLITGSFLFYSQAGIY